MPRCRKELDREPVAVLFLDWLMLGVCVLEDCSARPIRPVHIQISSIEFG